MNPGNLFPEIKSWTTMKLCLLPSRLPLGEWDFCLEKEKVKQKRCKEWKRRKNKQNKVRLNYFLNLKEIKWQVSLYHPCACTELTVSEVDTSLWIWWARMKLKSLWKTATGSQIPLNLVRPECEVDIGVMKWRGGEESRALRQGHRNGAPTQSTKTSCRALESDTQRIRTVVWPRASEKNDLTSLSITFSIREMGTRTPTSSRINHIATVSERNGKIALTHSKWRWRVRADWQLMVMSSH